MTQMEAASPPLPFPVSAVQRLRGHPSGLKGRCRDRCATGLRHALDPGASAAPTPRSGKGRSKAPARPTARRSRPSPYKQSLYGYRGLPDRHSAAARHLRVGARRDLLHPGIHRRPQRRPQPLQVDRHRRIDPRQSRASTHHPEHCQLIAGHTTSDQGSLAKLPFGSEASRSMQTAGP